MGGGPRFRRAISRIGQGYTSAMAYPPRIGVPRTEQFVTRVSKGELEAMHRVIERAGTTRSDYVRDLIRQDLRLQGENL